jgi:hypothetical protein
MVAEGVSHLLAGELVSDWALWSPTLLSFPSHFCDDRYFHQLYAIVVLGINFFILSCSNRNMGMSDLKL